MALPKISHPTFDVTIPSLKKKVKMRPMLVKEEKILLMAKTSGDTISIMDSIRQVVNNCIIDKKIDIDKLATFDVEYLFIKLRAYSVNNIVKVTYHDFIDNEDYMFEVDLDTVEVIFPENLNNKIKLSDNLYVVMKYPTAKLMSDDSLKDKIGDELNEYLIRSCIDKFYEGDTVYSAADSTDEELTAYIEELNMNTYDEMRKFVQNLPRLNHVIEYADREGNVKKIVMSKLNDFFTLR